MIGEQTSHYRHLMFQSSQHLRAAEKYTFQCIVEHTIPCPFKQTQRELQIALQQSTQAVFMTPCCTYYRGAGTRSNAAGLLQIRLVSWLAKGMLEQELVWY